MYGARLPAQHLLILAGVLLFFGWRGALLCALVWYWTQHVNAVAGGGGGGGAAGGSRRPGQGGGDQGQRMAAAQDYFQSMMDQPPLGRGGAGGRAGASGGSAPAGGAGQRSASDPWAARGKPRRLNDPQQ